MKDWIDLNSDVGESLGNYVLGRPLEVMQGITHANVACGYHAGDPTWIRRTVEQAKEYGVTIGGHPGFPDIMGFGRRVMNISAQEGKDYTIYQLGALKAFAEAEGLALEAAKPHSAFYEWAQQNEDNARGMLEGFAAVNPNIVAYLPALPTWPLLDVAAQMGMRVVKEYYPGLGYLDDGNLTHGAESSVEDTVRRTMKALTSGKAVAESGKEIEFEADSVAISGESMQAPEVLQALREAFAAEGIEVKSALRAQAAVPS
jgi:UPF0271 protein